jgi:hypothetical protein
MNWNTSLVLLWLIGSKTPGQCFNIKWKVFPEKVFPEAVIAAKGDQLHINAHDFGMRC